MVSKYKKSGWFNESQRHSLARKGIRTGKRYPDYASEALTIGGVSYEPVTVTTIPREDSIMKDADQIVAESQETSLVSPTTFQIGEEAFSRERFEKELEKEVSDEIEKDIRELEFKPAQVIKKKPWERIRSSIIETLKGAYQAYRDNDKVGIESHLNRLDSQKEKISERIELIQKLKDEVKSSSYRQKFGVAKQLKQLERIDKILESPKKELMNIDHHINVLENKKARLEEAEISGKPKREGLGVFPTFGEIMHPERLRKKDETFIPTEKEEKISIFPSFDEIMHPEKLRKR